MDLLHRILTMPADGTLRPVLPVNFDEYTKTLTIRSITKPWVITGERQAAAINYMFAQFQAGRNSLSAKEILAATYPDKQSGKSLRMQNLFGGNNDWENYIVHPDRFKFREFRGYLMDRRRTAPASRMALDNEANRRRQTS
jgi:hypothetical protein